MLTLPRDEDGRPRQWHRSLPGKSRAEAAEERERARELLDLAGADVRLRREIGGLLRRLEPSEPLPSEGELRGLLRSGLPAGSRLTVGEYLTWWIARRMGNENTLRAYRSHIYMHLIPQLGSIPLRELRAWQVEDMFTRLASRHRAYMARRAELGASPQPRAAGPITMKRIQATLRKALNDAMRRYSLISMNPAAFLEMPPTVRKRPRVWTDQRVLTWRRTGAKPSPVMVWTLAQAGRFLDDTEVHDPDLYALYVLVFLSGLRRGESIGVADDEVDLGQKEVTITHEITGYGARMVYREVKTEEGDRTVAISDMAAAALAAYRQRRDRLKRAAGAAWPETVTLRTPATGGGYVTCEVDLFFRRPDGRAWNPEVVSSHMRRDVEHAGLPPATLRDGRHAAASYTKRAGGDLLDIKDLLGHSTILMGGNVYTSPFPEVAHELAERTAQLVPRERDKTAPGGIAAEKARPVEDDHRLTTGTKNVGTGYVSAGQSAAGERRPADFASSGVPAAAKARNGYQWAKGHGKRLVGGTGTAQRG